MCSDKIPPASKCAGIEEIDANVKAIFKMYGIGPNSGPDPESRATPQPSPIQLASPAIQNWLLAMEQDREILFKLSGIPKQ